MLIRKRALVGRLIPLRVPNTSIRTSRVAAALAKATRLSTKALQAPRCERCHHRQVPRRYRLHLIQADKTPPVFELDQTSNIHARPLARTHSTYLPGHERGCRG